jgi:MSHA type pilus biogenesis protein MshL
MNICKIITAIASLFLLTAVLLLQGCAGKTNSDETNLKQAKMPEFKGQKQSRKNWDWQVDDTVSQKPVAKEPEPKFKTLNPLDTERVNISVVEERYDQILQILAHAAALNLIISPETTAALGNNVQLTAEYQDMSVRQVLDSVCRMLNVAWYEESGSLFIEPFVRRNIDLDFLGAVRQSAFEVGGDVLGTASGGGGGGGGGGGSRSSSSPLSGSFVVKGQTTGDVTDIYSNLDASITQLLDGVGTFVLNRQTGHLLVRSRPAIAKEIEEYVGILREKYRRQILIEAKIIEVGLNKKHELGIDWQNVGVFLSRTALRPASEAIATIVPTVGPDQSFYSLTLNSKYSDINGIFHALEEYGQLNILSNPRLKAMNGQSAIISVGQSVSYLASFEQDTEGTGDNRKTTYSTEIGSVFDGVLLGLTPIIENDGMVTLHIVPIKSDLVELNHVNFGPTFSSYQITLPRVNLREMSTMTRVHSGDVVLLGGLIMDYDNNDGNGVPFLSDIPYLGRLFKYESKEKRHVEMVVALHVTVVDANAAENR